jgi:hypothetical protein
LHSGKCQGNPNQHLAEISKPGRRFNCTTLCTVCTKLRPSLKSPRDWADRRTRRRRPDPVRSANRRRCHPTRSLGRRGAAHARRGLLAREFRCAKLRRARSRHRDGRLQSRRGVRPRSRRFPVAADRNPFVASGYPARRDVDLVHHQSSLQASANSAVKERPLLGFLIFAKTPEQETPAGRRRSALHAN